MAKPSQLVCQHLENISRDALEKYLPIIRRYDGWWFWKYERAPGDWVRLDELRK